jgi:hypothetical protein
LCIISSLVLTSAAFAGALDLTIRNVEIEPKPAGITTPTIRLTTNRSYRVTVTIQKTMALPKGASFSVRTDFIRNGKIVTLGESRVGDSKGWNIYACYDIFPAEAGSGEGMIRTTVDADNEIAESDEKPLSNVWERKATIGRP